MGQHYVPQNYLKAFSDPQHPTMIWMFDKSEPTHKPKCLPIKAVAQRPDFYTAEAETSLNTVVEIPAQEQFRRLSAGERIEDVDRLIVAIYIQVMALRVPYARNVLDGMVREGVADFVAAIKRDPNEAPTGMSDEFFHPMREPWIQQELVDMIYTMAWRIIRTDGPNAFFTGDNPVSFTHETGLLHPDGELTFPISSHMALHASWHGEADLMFAAGSHYAVAEINRRTACGAERFLFAAEPDVDVHLLATKPQPALYPFPW